MSATKKDFLVNLKSFFWYFLFQFDLDLTHVMIYTFVASRYSYNLANTTIMHATPSTKNDQKDLNSSWNDKRKWYKKKPRFRVHFHNLYLTTVIVFNNHIWFSFKCHIYKKILSNRNIRVNYIFFYDCFFFSRWSSQSHRMLLISQSSSSLL